MKAGRQRVEPVGLQLVWRTVGKRPDVSVEVVDSARTDIRNILQALSAHCCLAVSGEEELLSPNLHINLVGRDALRSVVLLNITAGLDGESSRLCEHGHNKDSVLHVLVSVWTALEVVSR